MLGFLRTRVRLVERLRCRRTLEAPPLGCAARWSAGSGPAIACDGTRRSRGQSSTADLHGPEPWRGLHKRRAFIKAVADSAAQQPQAQARTALAPRGQPRKEVSQP